VKFRLEALMSAGSYDDANNIILADLSEPSQFTGPPQVADGVTATLANASDKSAHGELFTATSSGRVPRNGAWAKLQRRFAPGLNLSKHQAIGVWVEGDGGGQVLAIRLESPRHISYGAIADRYVDIDFTGRRMFTLIETESSRWSDYAWNDGKGLYNVYRETIDFANVESLSIWYNNLPRSSAAKCVVGPIKAMPMRACRIKNPTIEVNGAPINFPVEMQSGSYLQFGGGNDCVLYDSKGAEVTKVQPMGAIPPLLAGENQIRFSCDPVGDPVARVRLTVFSHGAPL
jgi:hypothetical protein